MEILLILTVGALNIACFLFGFKAGKSVVKDEVIELPSFNPFKAYREREERKEMERKQDRIATIMHNIEAYDGTGANQKDVRE